MIRLLCIIGLLFLLVYAANSQCTVPTGFVCITQTQANDMAAKLDELKQSRDVIAKFTAERAATDAERLATTAVLKASSDAIDMLNKGIADRDKVIELYGKTVQLYADLVQKLTDKLNAPKSSFQKFMDALKTIATLAAGIAIGRL
jgi:septal ring factor EnvC (AmiA/AmiB activator)